MLEDGDRVACSGRDLVYCASTLGDSGHRGPKVDDLAEEWELVSSCVDALSGVSDASGRGGEGMGGWRKGGRSQQRKQPRGSRQGPRGRRGRACNTPCL
jgi:hypothetical protein